MALNTTHFRKHPQLGFTLIEISIVLIVIGLIVGGVLVGRDLISATAVRAQISQIEKYQTSVNTFRGKYGYLPGDIRATEAALFGFAARGVNPGQGDGNSVLEGTITSGGTNYGFICASGENGLFWRDLSTARLIDGSFTSAVATSPPITLEGNEIDQYFPSAKIGQGAYVFTYSYIKNYFSLAHVDFVSSGSPLNNYTGTRRWSLTVNQAHAIDQKLDDGRPGSGNVFAAYVSAGNPTSMFSWINATGTGLTSSATMPTAAASGSATTCYDNSNVAGVMPSYSLSQNNGKGKNCTLSFTFQ